MSKVSVIMPAFNSASFIGEAITSIINQTHQNWELLIMDDGSIDETFPIASTFDDQRIKLYRQDKNRGYLKTCNELFHRVDGDYVTFLDSDDTCLDTRLETCLKAIEKESADFISSDHTRFWADGSRQNFSDHIDYQRITTDPTYYPKLCGATLFVKRVLLEEVGGYDLAFDRMGAEDYHWSFRLALKGKGIHLMDKLYGYRQHQNQIRAASQTENFIAHDFDKGIRKALIVDHIDLLDPDNAPLLKKLRQELLAPFSKDSSLIQRYRATQLVNAAQFKQANATILKAAITHPASLANWKHLAYIAYVTTRRIFGI